MSIDEFIDTYSDDLDYLRDGREACLTHPLRAENSDLCNAAFCRLYAITMIGSLEAMLERWRARDGLNILAAYFAPDVKNGDRVKSLRDAFVTAGINVKHDVFDDYLAIKYLRNAIVHASWENQSGKLKQYDMDWITARNFPADTRKLTENHWQRMEWVNENMMFYIALTGMPNIKPRSDLVDVGTTLRPLPDTTGIIRSTQWPLLYWSNLERISATIGEQIQAAVLASQYFVDKGLNTERMTALPHEERKRHFYFAAQSASQLGFPPLAALRYLAEEALMCWRDYVRLTPKLAMLEQEKLTDIIRILRTIHERGILPKGGLLPEPLNDVSEDVRNRFFARAFGDISPLTFGEIAKAHRIGAVAYDAIRNITPLLLFSIYLPILDPDRMDDWRGVATQIADVFEIGKSWYSFVECTASPKSTIDFYREMSSALVLRGPTDGNDSVLPH